MEVGALGRNQSFNRGLLSAGVRQVMASGQPSDSKQGQIPGTALTLDSPFLRVTQRCESQLCQEALTCTGDAGQSQAFPSQMSKR